MDAVPTSERARVESALAWCPVLSLPERSSSRPDRFETVSMLLIEDGVVLLSTSNRGSPRRIVISLAGPGSILFPPATHERIEALTDVRMTLVPTSSNQRLLAIPAAANAIVGAAKDGLQDCRESLAQFASRRPVDRVLLKLIQLARSSGNVGENVVDLPLTHELLADMVGSTRETVTRALAQLARAGIIQHQRGRYEIAVRPATSASRRPL